MTDDKPTTAYEEYMEGRIEHINDLLFEALEHANTYRSHKEVRPSAMMGFDKVEKAHLALSQIDPSRGDPDEDDVDYEQ